MELTRIGVGAAGALVALPVAAPSAVTAWHADTPMTRLCVTRALTAEQLRRGERSKIDCVVVPAEIAKRLEVGHVAPTIGGTALDGGYVLAVHYDGGAGSTSLMITGSACNGSGVSLGGTAWDNRISSTTHGECGTVKHIDSADYTGDYEVTSGTYGNNVALGGMNNRSSSIRYG